MTCVYWYIVSLQLGTQIDVNSLLVCVGLEPGLAELSPDTRLLHTSKGNANITVVRRVDPDHAGLDVTCNAVCLGDVLGEKGSS
jgi:hypothetical protein